MITEETKPDIAQVQNVTEPDRSEFWWRTAVCAIFVLVCAACIVNNLFAGNTRVAFFCDGWHYFETCRNLTSAILELSTAGPAQFTSPPLSDGLLLDGPVLPGIFSLAFATLGEVPSASSWKVMVIGMSVFHAVSSVLVALVARHATGSRLLSVGAGLAWGVFPAAIFCTSRFMSETLVVLCLLAMIYFMVRHVQNARGGVATALLAGCFATLSALLKSPMIPAIAICVLVTSLYSARKWKSLLLIASSAALLMAPWATYTWITTGRPSVTLARVPVFNATVGCDLENDGWQVMNKTPMQAMFSESDSWVYVIFAAWKSHPVEMAKLTLSKISRFLALPYNDCRHRVFGLEYAWQVPFQIALLMTFFSGALLLLAVKFTSLATSARVTILLSTALVAGQLIYYLFEATPRAVFFVLPFMLLIGLVGVGSLRFHKSGGVQRLVMVGLAVVGTVLVWHSESLFGLHKPQEVEISLERGSSVGRIIDLSKQANSIPPKAAVVIVDGDSKLSDCALFVNGKKAKGRFISLNNYCRSYYFNYALMKKQAYLLGVPVSSLRQWRAIPIDANLIDWHGKNTVEVQAVNDDGVIYGSPDSDARLIPSFSSISSQKLTSSVDGLDMRTISPIKSANVESKSYQVSAAGRKKWLEQTPRIYIVARCSLAKDIALPVNAIDVPQPETSFEKALSPLDFDPVMKYPDSNSIRINRHILQYAKSTGADVEVSKETAASHFRIRVSGIARSLDRSGEVGISLCGVGARDRAVQLDGAPDSFGVSATPTEFVVEDVVPARLLRNRLKELKIYFYPGPAQQVAGNGTDRANVDALIDDLKVRVEPVDIAEFSEIDKLVY